jgi:hypothetical protein
MAAGEAIGLLLSLTTAGSGGGGGGSTRYGLLLALTSGGAAPPDTTGQTVFMPGGRAFTKRHWRELMALIAAEQAAQQSLLVCAQMPA